MRPFVLAAAAAVGLAGPAFGENTTGTYVDGNRLHQLCNSDSGMAQGYVTGVFDRSSIIYAITQSPSVMICSPEASTMTQITDVVCKFLKDNPKVRHYGAAAVVQTALETAFPCPTD